MRFPVKIFLALGPRVPPKTSGCISMSLNLSRIPLLSTIPDAARITGISIDTMRKALSLGQVRAIEVGDRQLIPRSELQRLAGERK